MLGICHKCKEETSVQEARDLATNLTVLICDDCLKQSMVKESDRIRRFYHTDAQGK